MVESRFPCIVKHVKAEAGSLGVKGSCREEVILVRNGQYRKKRCLRSPLGVMLEVLSSNRQSQFMSYSFKASDISDDNHQTELSLHTVLS